MATASSRPTFSCTVVNMLKRAGEFPEEAELVREAEKLVEETIAKLRPCLKYAVHPSFLLPPNGCGSCDDPAVMKEASRKVRTMMIGNDPDRPDELLLLAEDGTFIRVHRCSRGRFHDTTEETAERYTWHLWPFDLFFDSLTRRWEHIEQLKREHLDAVAIRVAFLRKARAAICGETPKEVR